MSLVELGWRQFTFFEKNIVRDPKNPDEKFSGLKVSSFSFCILKIFDLFGFYSDHIAVNRDAGMDIFIYEYLFSK